MGDDFDADRLDDERDRDELRRRYYGLMQELRVMLPGVQLLVGFLLTVPFNQRFAQLDGFGRGLWGVALVCGLLSVVSFVTPAAMHRFGERTARVERLETGIIFSRAGLIFLALTLLASTGVVTRFIFGTAATWAMVAIVALGIFGCWFAWPLASRRTRSTPAASLRPGR
ncbi:MAG: hypothetical protein JO291_16350 [Acidimicrobiia bacterium]|nr:hypothetical protein [Acidimicrobiia bacterium]